MADESTPVVQDTASERPVSPAQKEEVNMEVVADAPPKPESNSVVVGESGNTNKGLFKR